MAKDIQATILVLVLMELLALSSARTSEQRQSPSTARHHLHHHQQQKMREMAEAGGPLRVEVPRKPIPYHPGSSVTVYCRVTGGNRTDEYPRVSFYYQMNKYTIMPLGSGTQGIAIRTMVASTRDSDVHRVTNLLELGPEVYGMLRDGENRFYCKGSLPNGRAVRQYFVVRKAAPHHSRARHLHPLWTA